MLFLCAQSVSIGFHLNGVSTAKRSAKEMQSILKEAPMIERDPPNEKIDILVCQGVYFVYFDFSG